jgi:hypothetical protein
MSSITGAQVGAQTGVLKKRKENPNARHGPRPCMTALASTAGEDRRSMDQATRGEKDEEIAVRAEKEDGTG